MKRLLTSVLAAACMVAGTGSEGQAQEMMSRRASLFDLGVYGGGAYTTSWFESRMMTTNRGVLTDDGEGEGFRIGLSPIFGAMATFWANPSIGVRLHYGYMPSDLPEGENDAAENARGSWPLNNHFYDLDLVFRPWFANPGFMGGTYLFLGGGGLTTNVAGEGQGCIPEILREGACLSDDPEFASVGQGVLGIGFDLFPLRSNLGIFAELAAHGYDSPVHTTDGFVPRVTVRTGESFAVADDRFAVTTRFVAGIKLLFGDILPPPPPPVMVPPPPPPPPVVVEERPMQDIQVCVIQDGTPTTVTGQFNPTTGDTMVAGRRFSEAYPAMGPTYAAGATWFINNEPITIGRDRYVRFGLPRVVGTTEVMRMGDFQGTPVYVEAGMTGTPEVVYIPVRPGCEFQPYQRQEAIKVRG